MLGKPFFGPWLTLAGITLLALALALARVPAMADVGKIPTMIAALATIRNVLSFTILPRSDGSFNGDESSSKSSPPKISLRR